jgi:hypothetical protein
MIADIYLHMERTRDEVQILSHDIDVNGVDLTLIGRSLVVPIQLKSTSHGATTAHWPVRRRIPFPENYSRLCEAVLRPDGPATEGHGGALVVQTIVMHDTDPFARLWYRVATLPLVFLRDQARCDAIVKACRDCPETLSLLESDLTPPMVIGELVWLLLHGKAGSPLVDGDDLHPVQLLVVEPRQVEMARSILKRFEDRAWARWSTWLSSLGEPPIPANQRSTY